MHQGKLGQALCQKIIRASGQIVYKQVAPHWAGIFKIIVIMMCLWSVGLIPDVTAAGEKVAVLDFKSISAAEELGGAVAEILRTELIGLGDYTIIERGMVAQILKEQALQETGAVDSETAVKIGKLAGAKLVVIGSLVKTGAVFTINARLIDVETGIAQSGQSLSGQGDEQIPTVVHQLALILTGKAGVSKETPIAQATPAEPTPVNDLNPAAGRLRSTPLKVAKSAAQQAFGVNDDWRPRTYLPHRYEERGDVVVDQAAGLMWQKSGSASFMAYQDAPAYIAKLNRNKLAGYSDWRLPTGNELLSLVEQDKQTTGLYLNPIFDSTQIYCWTADTGSADSAWHVGFGRGGIYEVNLSVNLYVRAVRTYAETR